MKKRGGNFTEYFQPILFNMSWEGTSINKQKLEIFFSYSYSIDGIGLNQKWEKCIDLHSRVNMPYLPTVSVLMLKLVISLFCFYWVEVFNHFLDYFNTLVCVHL